MIYRVDNLTHSSGYGYLWDQTECGNGHLWH